MPVSSRAAAEHSAPRPPPSDDHGRVLYGLTQPLLGIRMLASHPALLQAALVPALLLAAVCAVVALLGDRGFFHGFYTTFALLAPLPSIVLAGHYARFAVAARHALGFAPAEPCIEPLGRLIRRTVKQFVLVTIALAPVTVLLAMVPGVGGVLVKTVAAAWALHWVVVEAFDSARVLQPGETIEDLDRAAERIRRPWYVRGLRHASDEVPVAGRLIGRFARLCDRLSMPWREEIALVEKHPALMFGFAVSTAALLAIPILNLAFRPIVIVGAVHVLGQLEAAAHRTPGEASRPVGAPAQ